ncbi:kinase-like protein [Sporormia fimetaria CBS 119925]|uniref:Kinase-like protein n=1 Tax=Sporormia fimetaria CBS 119925 TaxID=1340428 RepID=A0A6A6VMC3_9PLEO|nr:kinase-like protein [Sporormia fimetaria CBS 119925]
MRSTTSNHRELFEYTSGRWIYNEPQRLAERRLPFNVEELKKAAAKSMNKPTSDIESFRKVAEGGFNRVFGITLKDGSSILARLPYPATLPRRLAVASEVATMNFVRALGIPTPRILGYSADENAVGAEYMLMEKLPGKPIGDAWFDLSEQQRLKVLHQLVELEAKLFTSGLPASGSIYYAHDLPSTAHRVDMPGSDDGMCIGPYAALRWWFGERTNLDVDRGPHDDPGRALLAPAEKELAWIRAYGRPRFPFERAYRETFGYKKQEPSEHAKSLGDYVQLAPYLVPECAKLSLPILRHPDLQPNNIFVSEDITITGLIDWQHSVVLPTFLAAGMPNKFQNYNDEFRRRHKLNERHWHALEQDCALLKRRIYHDTGSPWERCNLPLQMILLWLCRTDEEMQNRFALDNSLREVDAQLENIHGLLGIASGGWTSNELFESAKEGGRLIKEEGLAEVDDDPWLREMSERHWPFDDFDEDE